MMKMFKGIEILKYCCCKFLLLLLHFDTYCIYIYFFYCSCSLSSSLPPSSSTSSFSAFRWRSAIELLPICTSQRWVELREKCINDSVFKQKNVFDSDCTGVSLGRRLSQLSRRPHSFNSACEQGWDYCRKNKRISRTFTSGIKHTRKQKKELEGTRSFEHTHPVHGTRKMDYNGFSLLWCLGL